MRILVSGMLAGVPGQGGASWAVLQYVLGLRQLGHDVMFVEPMPADPLRARSTAYFTELAARFGIAGHSALLDTETRATVGVPLTELEGFAADADLLLNISEPWPTIGCSTRSRCGPSSISIRLSRSSGARPRGSTWASRATTAS